MPSKKRGRKRRKMKVLNKVKSTERCSGDVVRSSDDITSCGNSTAGCSTSDATSCENTPCCKDDCVSCSESTATFSDGALFCSDITTHYIDSNTNKYSYDVHTCFNEYDNGYCSEEEIEPYRDSEIKNYNGENNEHNSESSNNYDNEKKCSFEKIATHNSSEMEKPNNCILLKNAEFKTKIDNCNTKNSNTNSDSNNDSSTNNSNNTKSESNEINKNNTKSKEFNKNCNYYYDDNNSNSDSENKNEKEKFIVKTEDLISDLPKAEEDIYFVKFGSKIRRIGKIYSCTFWRTQIEEDIFWSMQWISESGSGSWITTQYFGPANLAGRFEQHVTLVHPTEKKIKMRYITTCNDGANHIFVSKMMLLHFKNEDNSFNFNFRIVKRKKKQPTNGMIF